MAADRYGEGRTPMVTMATQGTSTDTADVVHLRVPADPAYLAVIRTAAAGLAARLDLTMDEIEDLRIAVDEACALLLDQRGNPGASLTTVFTSHDGTLEVEVRGPARPLPDRT